MKITMALEGGPRLLAVVSMVLSAVAIVYVALGQQLEWSQAVQLAVISGYGQLTAFITGSRT